MYSGRVVKVGRTIRPLAAARCPAGPLLSDQLSEPHSLVEGRRRRAALLLPGQRLKQCSRLRVVGKQADKLLRVGDGGGLITDVAGDARQAHSGYRHRQVVVPSARLSTSSASLLFPVELSAMP